MARKKLVVLVGAGASFDCASPDSNDLNTLLKPPLVKNLFQNNSRFNEVLRLYPRAQALSATIRSRMNSTSDLEAILRELYERKTLEEKKQFYHIPLYLQHLLLLVSDHYVAGGGTRYDALVNAIQNSSYEKVLYLTVNYDLFLDRAIEAAYVHQFVNPESYWRMDRPGQGWALVKLHGSVTWGRGIKNVNTNRTSHEASAVQICDTLAEPLDLTDEFVVAPWGGRNQPSVEMGFPPLARQQTMLQIIRKAPTNKVTHYPAISVPLKGKSNFQCPDEQIKQVDAFLEGCTDFLFIGFSGLDAHVVRLFNSVKKFQKVLVVSENRQSASEVLGNFIQGHAFFADAIRYDQQSKSDRGSEIVSNHGFYQFIETGSLQHFLTDRIGVLDPRFL